MAVVGEAAQVYIPEEWTEASEAVAYDSTTSPPPICLVCGPPNSGKTTFSRHLLNILLRRYPRAAYLDTDVGQAEFTAPGCLSLTVLDTATPDLAVPCLRTPERCFFFGDITAKRDPETYLAYIDALYDHYCEQHCTCHKTEPPSKIGVPLVVNTPGWVTGIGFNILLDMLKYISPSHVVKVCVASESKNLPSGAFWLEEGSAEAVTLVEINSAHQECLKKSTLVQKDARLLRDLRFVAYFRQCLPSKMRITTIQELDHRLAAHAPYEIPMSSVKIKHLHCEVPSNQNFYILTASIVGLAISSEVSENLPCCVGLGIVRGIDTFKQIVYLITPIPENIVKNVDLLLQGSIKFPACLSKVQGCISPYMASNPSPKN